MEFCFLKQEHQIPNSFPRCLEQSEWGYKQELGKIYVKLDEFDLPFQNISIDPLGHIDVKAFSKSRKIVAIINQMCGYRSRALLNHGDNGI